MNPFESFSSHKLEGKEGWNFCLILFNSKSFVFVWTGDKDTFQIQKQEESGQFRRLDENFSYMLNFNIFQC